MVNEGVSLHDRGDFEGAIAKYDEALKADTDNFLALSEKAYSLLALGKPDETVKICKYTLDKHENAKDLSLVFVTYGNALDMLKEPKKSIAIYNQGIKKYPDFYLLHFNKGITLAGQEKYDDASLSFQAALKGNPAHASSHNALARITAGTNQKVAGLLAYCRFLALEQKTQRAKENAAALLGIMGSGVKQTGENAITISVDAGTLNQMNKKSKKENDFSSAELMLSLSGAMDYEEPFKNENPAQRLARKMGSLIGFLGETANDNRGFFWDHYVPYFVEMKEKNFLEPFSNIVQSTAGDTAATEWLNTHAEDVQKFLTWSKGFAHP